MIYDRALDASPGRFNIIQLRDFTTWRIGGPCASVTVKNSRELADTVEFLSKSRLPWTVMGRGSNTLAPTEGWHGVVVFLGGKLAEFTFDDTVVSAGAGAHLPSMAGAACMKGLAGLVFAVGIPGTAGGALFMNAGAYGSSISELVEEVTVLHPDGLIEYLTPEQCGFGYRLSVFQTGDSVITAVRLRLSVGGSGSEQLKRDAREILAIRRQKFPLHAPNAGSVFRRPDNGPPPGKLIEDCGLKGYRVGGAMVSPTHANFIENTGGATSSDILRLLEHVTHRVRLNSGISLKTEIRKLGERI